MNREEIKKDVLKISSNNILLELATSVGKTKLAIELIKKKKCKKIMIVVPRLVNMDSWKAEFIKWGQEKLISNIYFITYVSFPKHTGKYDAIVFDEVQHLSDRCFENISNYEATCNILLSATVKKDLKIRLKENFENLYVYTISTKQAINDNILPDPQIILIPLQLDNTNITQILTKAPSSKKEITCSFNERWKYIRMGYKVNIKCTEYQYHSALCDDIDFWKRKYIFTNNILFKNKWLKCCSERLKWLSNIKINTVKTILNKLQDKRTLTFCCDIKQTEELGYYCINSKNKESSKYLDYFNKGKIKHITSCNMLNEGVNLTDCQYGIFAVMNASEIMQVQKVGRILRHKNPILIIPYYENTREEEILNNMMQSYNKDLVTKLTLEEYENNY